MDEVSAGRPAGVFITAEEAIAQIAAGQKIVVTDAEDRENEGDIVVAAEFATDEVIAFMARHARGLVCLALPGERCDALGLQLQPSSGDSRYGTAFTGSIEARHGVTTGISAQDRAETIRVAIDPLSTSREIVQPGHVFPLRARPGGVLERPGHTEAAVDLARLAGLRPGGVICEILKDDGTMARVDDLQGYCAEHGLSMVTIEELTAYRRRTEPVVDRIASAELPTEHGRFRIVGYRERYTGAEHVALVRGDVDGQADVLSRLHSACLTGDAFASARCDCGGQLDDALERIATEGCGVLVHLAQEGRGIGLLEKIRAYALQDSEGLDTVDANLALGHTADLRDFGVGAQILRDLGVRSVRLMTNNPHKTAALVAQGLPVTVQVPHERVATDHNRAYLQAKRDRMGHHLTRAGHLVLAVPERTVTEPVAALPADDRSWLPSVEMAV
jgi:3,4-dihydroxy 2-butanone 4-phosphate synthase/GTP cyclohydrolase II